MYVLGFCVYKENMPFEDTLSKVLPFYTFCCKLNLNCDEEIDKEIRKIIMTRKVIMTRKIIITRKIIKTRKIIRIIQRRKDIPTSLRIKTTNTNN